MLLGLGKIGDERQNHLALAVGTNEQLRHAGIRFQTLRICLCFFYNQFIRSKRRVLPGILKDRAYLCQHLTGRKEPLLQIIIGPEIKALLHIFLGPHRRQDNDRGLLGLVIGADVLQHIQPAELGHYYIEEDHIRLLRLYHGPPRLAGSSKQLTFYSRGRRFPTAMKPKKGRYQNRIELLQGTLDMLILRTLIYGAAHGHQIGKHIQRTTNDFLQMQHGSLYPALHRLEKRGWVVSKWETSPDRKREFKYYRLTEKGRKQLVAEESQWRQMTEAVARVMWPTAEGS